MMRNFVDALATKLCASPRRRPGRRVPRVVHASERGYLDRIVRECVPEGEASRVRAAG